MSGDNLDKTVSQTEYYKGFRDALNKVQRQGTTKSYEAGYKHGLSIKRNEGEPKRRKDRYHYL